MKLSIRDPHKRALRPKATIHKSGKLGFNSDATEEMGLETGLTFLVATNEDDDEDGNLYLLNCEDDGDERCIRVSKTGGYHYLNLRSLFDRIGVDYEGYKVIFDIDRGDGEYEGRPYYILNRRDVPRKRD